jgi:hypothetical protein
MSSTAAWPAACCRATSTTVRQISAAAMERCLCTSSRTRSSPNSSPASSSASVTPSL